ncbi:fas-binding factor 1 isoform X3 [Strix aluco]|uniref:fas-binding factor 1 isoform X3 n=1 Tax=Strix aluco TaxID=111821 RepID=UPI003DA399B4
MFLVSESVDDLLGDLLGYEDDESPVNSTRTSWLARGRSGRAWGTSSPASQKSRVAEDFFDRFPAEDVEAAEGSSASGGEPQGLLQSLKDLDDPEADLLGASRPGSRPGKTTVKEPPEAQTPLRTATPMWKRKELTFEEDGDDVMAALGLGSGPGRDGRQGKKTEEEEVRPARTKLDELLGQGSMTRTLEVPDLGERREVKLAKEYQKQPEKEEGRDKDDFVFGAYQPTVASIAKGRPARRQSLSRFSAEKNSELKAEPLSKAPLSASQSPARGRRNRSGWLGLKHEDFFDLELSFPAKASPAGSSPSPAAAGQPGPARQLLAAEEAATKTDPVEEEDWLSAALAQKKAQAQAKAQERTAKPCEVPSEGLNPGSPVRQELVLGERILSFLASLALPHRMLFACSPPAASPGARPQAAAVLDKAVNTDSSRNAKQENVCALLRELRRCCASLVSLCPRRPPLPWLSTMKQASARPLEAAQGDPSSDASALVPAASFPGEQETQRPAPLAQAESPALGLLPERRLGAPAAQPQEDATGCQAALLRAQDRVAELESQVRTLELARAQDKLLMETLQQRHQEDLDLLQSTHRSQVKVLEETCRQREQRLQQEKEQLAAQLLSQRQEAEQAQAELEQRSALELERLREQQRVSVQELRREHEEQLQRLKWLKDQEVDAVTSATSHTRTLNGVMDQIEKFSSNLRDILQKVEATHQTTSQELAMGAQMQEKQLKVLQDRLSQQQRDAEEERHRFQEVVAKMEARLDEQTRLLEQERQTVLAERSRAESLEEERRVITQQLSVERAELERAKSALLEERKLVTQKHTEERQKLAAEWAEFHTQQARSKEQDTARILPMDSQGEGHVRSLAKERAEVKIRVCALRAQEEQLAREKELLDEAWQELKAEREEVNGAALRVQQQEEELKSVTKLSSQKYEEGQRALQEARRVESQDQSRLQSLQRQLEQVKQQQERLHQDRLSMAQQKSQLQQLRQELSKSPTMLQTTGQDSSAPLKGSSVLFPLMAAAPHNWASVPGFPPPISSPGGIQELLARASSVELSATLAMMKFRALQDHYYLENEQFFLESLKKVSYKVVSLPG